jgi:hypothetical protein
VTVTAVVADRPVPVEQDGSAGSALLVFAE